MPHDLFEVFLVTIIVDEPPHGRVRANFWQVGTHDAIDVACTIVQQ
jgi:hypothetical protein